MIEKPRGTRDFLPHEMAKRRHYEGLMRGVCEVFGFGEVSTPTLEQLVLFTTKSGPGIEKEIYSFKDKGGRELALRPELTPSVARLYIEEMQKSPKPIKLYYFGNCYRYDEPQKGRYREFPQFGAEIIGGRDLYADAEIISLVHGMITAAGLKDFQLRIGHIGILRGMTQGLDQQQMILHYIDKKDFGRMGELLEAGGAPDLKEEITGLAQIRGGLETLKKAGELAGDGESIGYLGELCALLDAYGVKGYMLDFGLVRGLDYYTGMVFEIDYPGLGAEKQICGGGSYSLVEVFGGEKIFSTGFALGFDRVLLALEHEKAAMPERKKAEAYVIAIGKETRAKAIGIAAELRRNGIRCDLDISARSMSKALEYAHVIGAVEAVLVGEDELKRGNVIIRDMELGNQSEVPADAVARFIRHDRIESDG